MIDEHFSSPNLRKTISEPETGIERLHIGSNLHVRLPSESRQLNGSSILPVIRRYRFDPSREFRNRFSEFEAWRTFIGNLANLCWLDSSWNSSEATRGMAGSGPPTFLQDQFCNSSKSDEKLLGGGGLKSKYPKSLYPQSSNPYQKCKANMSTLSFVS